MATRLTAEDLEDIAKRISKGEKRSDIATLFGVTAQALYSRFPVKGKIGMILSAADLAVKAVKAAKTASGRSPSRSPAKKAATKKAPSKKAPAKAAKKVSKK